MPKHYYISEELHESIYNFFTQHNMQVLSTNLRRQFIDYLDRELETGVPLYFDEFLFPFNCLLDVLDKAATEVNAFTLAAKNKTVNQTQQTIKEKAIAFLMTSLSPEKIFLVHHSITENNKEAFDFLVVLPDVDQTNFNAYGQVISLANIEGATTSVSLHKATPLYKQLQEGHIYYSVACTAKKLVYNNGSTILPQADKRLLKAIVEQAQSIFNNGYKKAQSFLQNAGRYAAAHDADMAAFMLHQSIELLLRGMITALLGSCTKTHCFKELKKPLKRCAPEINYLISPDETEENRLLHLLEKAYLESRYSDAFEISNADVEVLLLAIKKLHERLKELFYHKLNSICT